MAGATERALLPIDGTPFGTCPVTVRVTLENLDGVKNASVSVKEGRALVDYDPAKVTPERMAKVVAEAGCAARSAVRP
jgi:copper chaperone CopZ